MPNFYRKVDKLCCNFYQQIKNCRYLFNIGSNYSVDEDDIRYIKDQGQTIFYKPRIDFDIEAERQGVSNE